MPFIENVMKAMTHLNIGAAIAMLAWILWSGQHIMRGDVPAAVRYASVQTAKPTAAPAPAAQPRSEVHP